ncbi:helix-turn-helix domain-containing protein [Streptomyces sp. NPDC053560]|uniref:helix-turn-helix domain-containing protein n=1 Tax=Streptomyces sp. NPDC053560 TaxID=3365711 RepID=UPI0037D676F3
MQDFANTLKRLIHHVRPGTTMAQKAKALHVSPPLLSHWLNGRRLPRLAAVEDLSRLALEEVTNDQDVAALACEFAVLKSLLHAARRTAGARTCNEAGAKRDRRNIVSDTADEGDRRNGPLGTPAGKRDRRNGPSTAAPPCGERSALLPKPDFPARLAAMAVADRVDILQSLAAALSEAEVGAAADALARAGMKGDMEILIRSAGSAGRNSMEIAIALGGLR